MKRVIAAVLCFIMLFSVQTIAYAEDGDNVEKSGFTDVIADSWERFISVFRGSTNEKSDIEYSLEAGSLFEKKVHFKSSHASTVVKMNDGRLMSAYFAGDEEGADNVRIWFSVYENGEWRLCHEVK